MTADLPIHENVVKIPLTMIKIKENRYRQDMGDIQGLAESIKERGQIQPILISSDFSLIAGERRYRAHELLKMDTINAIIRTQDQIGEKITEILENLERKEFTWQEETMAKKDLHQLYVSLNPQQSERKTAEAVGLSAGGFTTDLNLADALEEDPEMFKNCKNKTAALKKLKEFEIDEAMAEIKLRKSKTNYGKSAKNFIFEGNALDLIDQLPEGIVNIVMSDPKYGIDINKVKKIDDGDADIYEDDPTAYFDLMQQIIAKLPRAMNVNSAICLFCAVQNKDWILKQLTSHGFKCDPIPGIWVRGGGQTMQPNYNMARSYEIFIYGFRGDAQLIRPGLSNVLSFPGVPTLNKEHEVQKPLALMEELISRFALPGHTILDFMCGSGTTAVAAIKRGCTPIGFELLEKNYNTSISRVADALNAKDAGKLELVSDVLVED